MNFQAMEKSRRWCEASGGLLCAFLLVEIWLPEPRRWALLSYLLGGDEIAWTFLLLALSSFLGAHLALDFCWSKVAMAGWPGELRPNWALLPFAGLVATFFNFGLYTPNDAVLEEHIRAWWLGFPLTLWYGVPLVAIMAAFWLVGLAYRRDVLNP